MSSLADKEILKIVAKGLKDLLPEVVFVGGITTFLYMLNDEAPAPTATDDVDLVLEVTTLLEYERLEKRLGKLGFKRNLASPGPLCRFEFGEVKVDFMPIEPKILGFSNRWYSKGFEKSIKVKVDDFEIRIFDLPYYYGSKLEAFKDRGAKGAFWESKDFEDIVTILDTRPDSIKLIESSDQDLQSFLKQEFKKLLHDESRLREGVESVLTPYGKNVKEQRTREVISLIKQITN